ncbi:MAG: GtrA family protein [Bacteroidales bacterium]|nr:GtrA family protein [Bacteroidales bacterium]MDZ4204330.1 GtrA family protein [Bacteroidales bacterium]
MQSRFFKFFVSRLLGTLGDTLVLWVLTRYVFFSYAGKYLAAPAISFEVAMFFNYVISYFWVWNKHIPMKVARDFFTRLVPYNISTLVGFVIKMGFLLLFERLFRWDVIYCNIAALLISGVVNFLLAEMIVFKKHAHIPIIDGHALVKDDEENTHSV